MLQNPLNKDSFYSFNVPSSERLIVLNQDMLALSFAFLNGTALGDAIGLQTEPLTDDLIAELWGTEGVTAPNEKGMISDDSQFAMMIARAISKDPNASPQSMADEFALELIKWINEPSKIVSPGKSCLLAAVALKEGAHWSTTGSPDADGCGAAMRSAAIGYLFSDSLEHTIAVAETLSAVTHKGQIGKDSGVAVAMLAYYISNAFSPLEATLSTARHFKESSPVLSNALFQAVELSSEPDKKAAQQKFLPGWRAEEVVAVAMLSILQNENDWRGSVLSASNFGGDSDSTAALAGGLHALHLAGSGIPQGWPEMLNCQEEIKLTAESLAAAKAARRA